MSMLAGWLTRFHVLAHGLLGKGVVKGQWFSTDFPPRSTGIIAPTLFFAWGTLRPVVGAPPPPAWPFVLRFFFPAISLNFIFVVIVTLAGCSSALPAKPVIAPSSTSASSVCADDSQCDAAAGMVCHLAAFGGTCAPRCEQDAYCRGASSVLRCVDGRCLAPSKGQPPPAR
jgi:hypothetical protein